MTRGLAAALVLAVVAGLIAVFVVARRDPRYRPSPYHRVADPVAAVLLALVGVAVAVFLLVGRV